MKTIVKPQLKLSLQNKWNALLAADAAGVMRDGEVEDKMYNILSTYGVEWDEFMGWYGVNTN